MADLIGYIDAQCRDPSAFYATPSLDASQYDASVTRLSFPSAYVGEFAPNGRAYARLWRGATEKPAVAILRHWNAADADYVHLARAIHAFGYSVALLTLPWHGERNRPRAPFSDDFLSANLSRTVASVRQAVSDLRRTLDWLEACGHPGAVLVAASLGTSVASMTSVVDSRVRATALLLTAGDFAEVVWNGGATRHIRATLERRLTLPELRACWRIIGPAHFLPQLTLRAPQILMIGARRDTVVAPEASAAYLAALRAAGLRVEAVSFNCGHYTMGVLPYNIRALRQILSFLRDA